MPPRQRERLAVGEKWWRSGEEPSSENRRVAGSPGLTVASRLVPRGEENHQRRRKETNQPSGQRGASPAAKADLASNIEQLLSHLRSMVSLLARTVSPFVEGRMTEKRRKATLEQATTMMVAVSHFPFREILLVFSRVMSSLIVFSLF